MIIKNFYNREKELKLLSSIKKPFLAVIYGRRRIGKTSLALKFVENKDYIYFFVNPKKPEKLLMEEFFEIVKSKIQVPEYVKPSNWDQFFEILFKNYNGYVIFDEFQWFLDINSQVPYILQKYWDLHKGPSVLIIGSIIGMVKKLFIKQGSPLFKRADASMNLKELDLVHIFKWLDDIGINDLVKKFEFYLLFGGSPYYYKLIEKYDIKNIKDAIERLVLDEYGPLRHEVEEVLIESFKREYKTYLAILYAIAEGKTKLSEIASTAQIKETSIWPYLEDLMRLLGIVERHNLGFSKRKSIYLIKDKFYNFWLRYVYKYSSFEKENLLKIILNDINTFFGWSFETTMLEHAKRIFPNYEKYCKYYGQYRKNNKKLTFDIDILALNEGSKELLAVECKWKDYVEPKRICSTLLERLGHIQWYKDQRKEHLAIFAKSFKEKITKFKGRKVYCYDLKDTEKILSRRKV